MQDTMMHNAQRGALNNGNLGMRMAAGSCYIPKRNRAPLGEDAHFICIPEQTIGVADGVAGWAKQGINAGVYARELIRNAVCSIHQIKAEGNIISPWRVLNDAFYKTKSKGSSTACFLTLSGDALHAVNVGDSGFVVIRDGVIVYKSEIQQRSFNHPYQLGKTSDNPSYAKGMKVQVKLGDVIVMGTDGLFDNVHDFELEMMVRNGLQLKINEEKLARKIAKYALENSKDEVCITPYTAARIEAGQLPTGGKPDDITVIVAHILPKGRVRYGGKCFPWKLFS